MKPLRLLSCILLTASLCACASSPPFRYFSLDDDRPTAAGSPTGVSVAITAVNLPELVDRPQMVVRHADHRVQFNEHDRWAEPLRRQVPRLLGRYLGEALDSSRVAAGAVDAEEPAIDFKLVVDVQRLDVFSGQRVELDAVWRVEPRNGRAFFGRASVLEGLAARTATDEHAAAIDAERSAFRTLAGKIAASISDRPVAGDSISRDDPGCRGSSESRHSPARQL